MIGSLLKLPPPLFARIPFMGLGGIITTMVIASRVCFVMVNETDEESISSQTVVSKSIVTIMIPASAVACVGVQIERRHGS